MKNNSCGMTLIVKTITRLTVGLILIYGIYIVLQGHLSPGGGFAGGIIIALSFIHLMLAFGKEEVLRKLNKRICLLFACSGAIAFLFISALNFAGKGKFFPALPDIAIALMVGPGLFAIFLSLVLLIGEIEEK